MLHTTVLPHSARGLEARVPGNGVGTAELDEEARSRTPAAKTLLLPLHPQTPTLASLISGCREYPVANRLTTVAAAGSAGYRWLDSFRPPRLPLTITGAENRGAERGPRSFPTSIF